MQSYILIFLLVHPDGCITVVNVTITFIHSFCRQTEQSGNHCGVTQRSVPLLASSDRTLMTVCVPTEPAWFGCRSVSTVTSRTCGEPGWGQVAWQPGRPPAGAADHRLGALWNSSIRTGRRNTRSLLQAKQRVWGSAHVFRHLVLAGERRIRLTRTRGGEERSPQLVVCGDLPDLCTDVDESTHHRRDPVEAQQPVTGRGQATASGLWLYTAINSIALPLYLSRWKAAISALCLSKSEK